MWVLDCRSAKHSTPNISIVQCRHTGYWLITIACKDRSKLLFDTVRSGLSSLQFVLVCTIMHVLSVFTLEHAC